MTNARKIPRKLSHLQLSKIHIWITLTKELRDLCHVLHGSKDLLSWGGEGMKSGHIRIQKNWCDVGSQMEILQQNSIYLLYTVEHGRGVIAQN